MDRVDSESLVIQDLINLDKTGELNLTPWYQRRSVWSSPQKSYLINTIFEKKPIPAIYIRHSLDLENERSVKEVVDGQQRIRAILEYVAGNFSARHPDIKKSVKFGSLNKNQAANFLMTSLAVGYLIGADDNDVIDIFGRINSVSKNLNAQENRNAKFSGEFKQFCLKESSNKIPFWRDRNIFSANDIARMNEVQFVSDLVINLIDGLTDYSAPKINQYYKRFDEHFSRWENISERLNKCFDCLASLEPEVIKDTIFSRPPILFSLMIVMDQLKKYKKKEVEPAIVEIDRRFNVDTPVPERNKKEAGFYLACTASTQRISQRKVRDKYIRSFI